MPTLRPRVITAADARHSLTAGQAQPAEDPYVAKVVKYIPAEVVAAYQAGAGIILDSQAASKTNVLWAWVAFLFILCPFWMAFATRERGQPIAWFQTLIAPVAFLVWVFALGGPFEQAAWYEPLYGSLALIAMTLVVPILEKVLVRRA